MNALKSLAQLLVVALSGFVTATTLMPWLIRWAPRLGLLDVPNARKLHARPIPRCGGFSLFAGLAVALGAAHLLRAYGALPAEAADRWHGLAALMALTTLIGAVDDTRGLRPWQKLVGQVAVGLLAYALQMRVGAFLGIRFHPALDVLMTVGWFVGLMNAYNLIDGMDGLASGLGLIAAAGLGGVLVLRRQYDDLPILAGFVGATLGFLRFNLHPARAFLGDTGSMLIGCIVAAVGLRTGNKDAAMTAVAVPILAAGVPLLDTGLAVWRRAARMAFTAPHERGAGVMQADAEHLHHRLLRGGMTVKRAVMLLHGVAAVLALLGLVGATIDSHVVGLYLIAFVLGVYLIVRHVAHVELWDSGMALMRGMARAHARAWAVMLYIPADVLLMIAAIVCAHLLLHGSAWMPATAADLHEIVPLWVGFPFIFLALTRSYQCVWSRASFAEFFMLGATATVGIVVALGVTLLLGQGGLRQQTILALVYAGLLIPTLLTLRVVPRSALDILALLSWRRHRGAPGAARRRRLLLVGAGPVELHVLHAKALHGADLWPQVVGLVDEDANLHGRYVQGYRVLGGLRSLGPILDLHSPTEVIVADGVGDEELKTIKTEAARRHLPLIRWRLNVETLAAAADSADAR